MQIWIDSNTLEGQKKQQQQQNKKESRAKKRVNETNKTIAMLWRDERSNNNEAKRNTELKNGQHNKKEYRAKKGSMKQKGL